MAYMRLLLLLVCLLATIGRLYSQEATGDIEGEIVDGVVEGVDGVLDDVLDEPVPDEENDNYIEETGDPAVEPVDGLVDTVDGLIDIVTPPIVDDNLVDNVIDLVDGNVVDPLDDVVEGVDGALDDVINDVNADDAESDNYVEGQLDPVLDPVDPTVDLVDGIVDVVLPNDDIVDNVIGGVDGVVDNLLGDDNGGTNTGDGTNEGGAFGEGETPVDGVVAGADGILDDLIDDENRQEANPNDDNEVEEIGDNVVSPVDGVIDVVDGVVDVVSPNDDILDNTIDLVDGVVDAVDDIVTGVDGALDDLIEDDAATDDNQNDNTVEVILDPIVDPVDGVVDVVDGVVDVVSPNDDIVDNVVDGVDGLVDDLLSDPTLGPTTIPGSSTDAPSVNVNVDDAELPPGDDTELPPGDISGGDGVPSAAPSLPSVEDVTPEDDVLSPTLSPVETPDVPSLRPSDVGSIPNLIYINNPLTVEEADTIYTDIIVLFGFQGEGSYGLHCEDCDMGKTIGALVRLAYADAVGEGGTNGCIDFATTDDHRGLEDAYAIISALHLLHALQITKADLIVLAATIAIEYATSTPPDSEAEEMGGFVEPRLPYNRGTLFLPYYWGRADDLVCIDRDFTLSPMATYSDMSGVFLDRFGMDYKEMVAIMGAHSIGQCSYLASGIFNGGWTNTQSSLSNDYFTGFATKEWELQTNYLLQGELNSEGLTGDPYYESSDGFIRLVSDVEMYYETTSLTDCPTEPTPHPTQSPFQITDLLDGPGENLDNLTDTLENLTDILENAPTPSPSLVNFPSFIASIPSMLPTFFPTGPTFNPTTMPTIFPTFWWQNSADPADGPNDDDHDDPTASPTLAPSGPSFAPTQMPTFTFMNPGDGADGLTGGNNDDESLVDGVVEGVDGILDDLIEDDAPTDDNQNDNELEVIVDPVVDPVDGVVDVVDGVVDVVSPNDDILDNTVDTVDGVVDAVDDVVNTVDGVLDNVIGDDKDDKDDALQTVDGALDDLLSDPTMSPTFASGLRGRSLFQAIREDPAYRADVKDKVLEAVKEVTSANRKLKKDADVTAKSAGTKKHAEKAAAGKTEKKKSWARANEAKKEAAKAAEFATLEVPTPEPTTLLDAAVPTVAEVLQPTYPPDSCNCYRFGGVESLRKLVETDSPKCPFQGESKNIVRAYGVNIKWWYGNFTTAWEKMVNYPYDRSELSKF